MPVAAMVAQPVLAPNTLTGMKIELPGTGNNEEQYGGCRTVEAAYDFNDKIDQIGEGTYGQVYLGKCKKTGAKVALKKIRMDTEKEGFPITAIREIRILFSLNHPNVIKMRDIVRSQVNQANNFKGHIYMVFDFMDHDLTGLQDRHGGRFTLPDVKCYMMQLLKGLEFCHKNGVLHRDLKASNLLIDHKGILKLADFGLARLHQNEEGGRLTNRVITLWYRPPELLLGADTYGFEVDLWSVGCILAELLTGKPLFPGKDETDQLDRILQVFGAPTEATWPGVTRLEHLKNVVPGRHAKAKGLVDLCKARGIHESAWSLLEGLLTLDPKRRITAKDAYEHSFFKVAPKPTETSKLQKYDPSHEWTMKKMKRERQQQGQGHRDHSNDPNKRPRHNQQHPQQQGGHAPHHQPHPRGGYAPQAQQRHYRGADGAQAPAYSNDQRNQRAAPYGGSSRQPPPHGGYPAAGPVPPYAHSAALGQGHPPGVHPQPGAHPPAAGHWQGSAPYPQQQAYANAPNGPPPPFGPPHTTRPGHSAPYGGYPPPAQGQAHGKPQGGSYGSRDPKHQGGHGTGGGGWQGDRSQRR